jgi:cytochrome c oxidase assembly protein subunit 15
MTHASPRPIATWLRWWAYLTVGVTLVQLLLGSVVTTFDVGMADPQWPTAPWYLLHTTWGGKSLGFLIEHTHRLTGSLVGLCVIVLAVGLWLGEPRVRLLIAGLLAMVGMVAALALGFAWAEPWAWFLCLGVCFAATATFGFAAFRIGERSGWLRWLGMLALAGVILQGLLGGFRVFWHAEMGLGLKIVHGCAAQVFFAFMAGLALLLAHEGRGPREVFRPTPWLRRWSLVTLGLVLGQVVLGALLRHTLDPVWQRGHLLAAFAVVAAVAELVKLAYEDTARDWPAMRMVLLLAALVVAQLLLGVEAWMVKFSSGVLPELVQVTVPAALIRTGHVLVGSLILATATMAALKLARPQSVAVPVSTLPVGRLEGAA